MTTALALPKTLHITALAVPLAGWTLHTAVLRRRLVQAQRDPLTSTWRREEFTERAQRLFERHPDEVVLVLADADHFKQLNDRQPGHAQAPSVNGRREGRPGTAARTTTRP